MRKGLRAKYRQSWETSQACKSKQMEDRRKSLKNPVVPVVPAALAGQHMPPVKSRKQLSEKKNRNVCRRAASRFPFLATESPMQIASLEFNSGTGIYRGTTDMST